jgi:hypothetical protein
MATFRNAKGEEYVPPVVGETAMASRVRQLQVGSGKTRDKPIVPELVNLLEAVGNELDVYFEVTSGGQVSSRDPKLKDVPGGWTGSTRHNDGKAADTKAYVLRDGQKHYLDFTDSSDRQLWSDIVRLSVAGGATGIGAGNGYMGPQTVHIGYGGAGTWGAKGRSANAPEWLKTAYASGRLTPPLGMPSGPPVPVSMPPGLAEARAFDQIPRPDPRGATTLRVASLAAGDSSVSGGAPQGDLLSLLDMKAKGTDPIGKGATSTDLLSMLEKRSAKPTTAQVQAMRAVPSTLKLEEVAGLVDRLREAEPDLPAAGAPMAGPGVTAPARTASLAPPVRAPASVVAPPRQIPSGYDSPRNAAQVAELYAGTGMLPPRAGAPTAAQLQAIRAVPPQSVPGSPVPPAITAPVPAPRSAADAARQNAAIPRAPAPVAMDYNGEAAEPFLPNGGVTTASLLKIKPFLENRPLEPGEDGGLFGIPMSSGIPPQGPAPPEMTLSPLQAPKPATMPAGLRVKASEPEYITKKIKVPVKADPVGEGPGSFADMQNLMGVKAPTVAPTKYETRTIKVRNPDYSPRTRAVTVAPRPATISRELNAQRDTAGSGLGGLANVIGALLGTNKLSPTRAPIPYQPGSGQSYQTAIYGESGGSYGSSPGQMTGGLAPGQRVYDPDRNAWGLKGSSGSSGGGYSAPQSLSG